MTILLSILAAALMTGATDQEPAPLSYEDSMRCAAFFGLMSAFAEEEGDTEAAADADDVYLRWVHLSVLRDGREGVRAEEELGMVIEQLAEKLEGFGDDEAAAEEFVGGIADKCEALTKANQEEFDAIDVEAIRAEAAAMDTEEAGSE